MSICPDKYFDILIDQARNENELIRRSAIAMAYQFVLIEVQRLTRNKSISKAVAILLRSDDVVYNKIGNLLYTPRMYFDYPNIHRGNAFYNFNQDIPIKMSVGCVKDYIEAYKILKDIKTPDFSKMKENYEKALTELCEDNNVEFSKIEWSEDDEFELFYVDIKVEEGDLDHIHHAWADSKDERFSFKNNETIVMAEFYMDY